MENAERLLKCSAPLKLEAGRVMQSLCSYLLRAPFLWKAAETAAAATQWLCWHPETQASNY